MSEVLFGREYGLGDVILVSGLIHHLTTMHDKVWITSLSWNYESTVGLFKHNPKVGVLPIVEPIRHWLFGHRFFDRFEGHNLPIIDQDLWEYREETTLWYHWLYEQFNIPYKKRFEWFQKPKYGPRAEEVYERVAGNNTAYRLVHNASSTCGAYPFNMHQSSLKTVYMTPDISSNFMDWLMVIDCASEIHVPHTSSFWYVDSLQTIHSDLYYHDIRKSNDPLDLHDIKYHNPRWNIITYNQQI